MKSLRTIVLLASVAGLQACQQVPNAAAPAPGAVGTAPAPDAMPAVAEVPASPPAPAPVVPVTPASQHQAQKTALAAVGMLEAGREDEARAELQRALSLDPNNKLALNLKRQVESDPVAALGRESFNYVVRPNESLSAIDRPVDMVQVFRSSDALLGIAREAIDIGAKVLWAQLGVRNDEAARLAEAAGLRVVMNRCPKIELFRPFWKPRLNQAI